jgi:hypothetical protein
MKFIQSWWDLQNKGLPEKEIPLMELSRMTLEHNFGNPVTFYTNLSSTEGLNYKEVKPLDMTGYPKEIWCLGKLVVMSQQTEPFIHFDTDLFLWKQTPIKELEKPFIVFHHETWAQKFMSYAQKIPAPPSLGKSYDTFDSNNYAIIGGTHWKDLIECIQEVLEHVKKYQEEIVKVALEHEEGSKRLMWTPVLVEQVWVSQLMRKRKIPPVTFLGDKWRPFNLFYEPNLIYRAKKRGVAHYWADTKDRLYGEIVEAYNKWKNYLEPNETIELGPPSARNN